MESKIERRMSKELETDLKSLKSLKDCNNLSDIDFDKVELIRGETPEDIQEKCLKLCKDYLAGNWIQQTVDTIQVRRISGGMTNQLYYCGISNPSTDCADVPQEVAVRLYGPKYFNVFDCNGNERLTDVIIALMVSQNKLGPKIYGLFENGQIQHFYKHRQFKVDEQKDPVLVSELFRKLARVHAMDVPIKKSHWFFTEIDNFYESANKHLNEMIDEVKSDLFVKYDLKTEINWIKELVLKTNSPMVFTHNDFRSSNIMVLDNNNNKNNNIVANEQIVLCDFEYSSYGYRGYDLGLIVCEWDRSMSDFTAEFKFPEDSTIIPLINIYIEESEKIFGKKYSENKINSLEQILKETKVFGLAINLFFTLFCLKENENESIPMNKTLMRQMAETTYKTYWSFKNAFIQQNVFV